MKNSYSFTIVIFLAAISTISISLQISSLGQANAYHEQKLRDMGIGYNDYDIDGVTCAATDEDADSWSDQFYNHHDPNINQLITCEKKEASYAGQPDYADNRDHIQDLIDQYNRMYPPGWADR